MTRSGAAKGSRVPPRQVSAFAADGLRGQAQQGGAVGHRGLVGLAAPGTTPASRTRGDAAARALGCATRAPIRRSGLAGSAAGSWRRIPARCAGRGLARAVGLDGLGGEGVQMGLVPRGDLQGRRPRPRRTRGSRTSRGWRAPPCPAPARRAGGRRAARGSTRARRRCRARRCDRWGAGDFGANRYRGATTICLAQNQRGLKSARPPDSSRNIRLKVAASSLLQVPSSTWRASSMSS